MCPAVHQKDGVGILYKRHRILQREVRIEHYSYATGTDDAIVHVEPRGRRHGPQNNLVVLVQAFVEKQCSHGVYLVDQLPVGEPRVPHDDGLMVGCPDSLLG